MRLTEEQIQAVIRSIESRYAAAQKRAGLSTDYFAALAHVANDTMLALGYTETADGKLLATMSKIGDDELARVAATVGSRG